MSTQNKISWQAPEFKHYNKTIGWYVALISIAILISGFFVVQKDIFAAITTIILAGLVLLFSKQKPEIVPIEINDKTVKFGQIEYPYKQIKHFWVVHNERHKTVNLRTTTYVNNTIILELGTQNSEEVRNFLLKYLPEHETTDETFAQRLMHWLKF